MAERERAPVSDYAAFLASKHRTAPAIGREVSDSDIHPMLHPWQRRIVVWAVGRGRAALWEDTGTGKTVQEVEIARLSADRSLIIAPLAVCQQTVREAAKVGVTARYARSDAEAAGPGVWVTNYEMATRFDPSAIGAVVLDECFAQGTLIDMADGSKKHIEDVRVGDEIINAIGVDTVADIHRREVPYAIQVAVSGRTIVSSPNHPYFTQRGWVGAQDLKPGDSLLDAAEAVRMVREAVHEENGYCSSSRTVLRSILLSEVADEAAGVRSQSAYPWGCSEARREAQNMASVGVTAGPGGNRPNSRAQSYGGPGGAEEDLPHIESHAPRTFRAWGQWPWLDRAAAASAGCTWTGLEGGVRFVTGPADARLSHELQAGLGATRAANRDRGGWSLTSQSARPGREEGREAGFARVDGAEVLEPGDPRLDQFRDASGKLYFYDLGATRHPSYSVADRLVHNSSILKQSDGKTRTALIRHFDVTPRRFTATATPAPNDMEELTNQAEFLGVAARTEMLAAYFVHDEDGWRLKGHARRPMFRWMASWAVALSKPSDIGGSDDGYILPGLDIIPHLLDVDVVPEGQLFATDLGGVSGRAKIRRATLDARCETAAKLVCDAPGEPWILWAGLNAEADRLAELIPGAVNVEGSWTPEAKADAFLAFADGNIKHLVTKTSIAAFGLNFQHCANMAFVGLSDSYEQYYQAIRRCYRYGQRKRVRAHIILSELEGKIADNVQRKERQAADVTQELVREMREAGELRV
jgi:hypothetical protein